MQRTARVPRPASRNPLKRTRLVTLTIVTSIRRRSVNNSTTKSRWSSFLSRLPLVSQCTVNMNFKGILVEWVWCAYHSQVRDTILHGFSWACLPSHAMVWVNANTTLSRLGSFVVFCSVFPVISIASVVSFCFVYSVFCQFWKSVFPFNSTRSW